MRYILLIGLLVFLSLPNTLSLEFKTILASQQKFCFYEVLEAQQKYTFVTHTGSKASHSIEVAHIYQGQWRFIFERSNNGKQNSIRVDKLASTSTTYSFCIKNQMNNNQMFKVQFNTGIAVMELHNLPDSNDGENLERELKWLDQQTNVLSGRADNIEKLRRINYQINHMIGTKMFVFAIIGLIVIASANIVFYKILKKAFKDRKLI